MPCILRHLFTGKDNETWDLGRVSWGASFVGVCALTAFHCWKGSPPSITEFATAAVAVAAGHAVAIFAKKSTEPSA